MSRTSMTVSDKYPPTTFPLENHNGSHNNEFNLLSTFLIQGSYLLPLQFVLAVLISRLSLSYVIPVIIYHSK